MGVIDESKVRHQVLELNEGPIPYSTHDLAISTALNFFKRPEYIPLLFNAQILARAKALDWFQKGLAAKFLVLSFENVLYKLYKP